MSPELAPVDFQVTATHLVADQGELAQRLRSATGRVRLCGGASRQLALPAPDRPVQLLSTRRMDRITRLDPEDLTCSVQPGLPVEALQRALAEHRLWLPVEDHGAVVGGTVGGLFAEGHDLPAAPSAPNSRHLLLGLRGLLAEGLRFKSGSQVVKSVAGFDLHKLFVGSRGRLFAATELHLKLRPLPERVAWFDTGELDADSALRRFAALRADSFPPRMLRLEGSCADRLRLLGRYEGRDDVLSDRLRRHALDEVAPIESRSSQGEEVAGLLRPSRIADLLRCLPETVHHFAVAGTGQFAIQADQPDADRLLESLSTKVGAAAAIRRSERPARRGLHTPGDAGAERLSEQLARALDPKAVLA